MGEMRLAGAEMRRIIFSLAVLACGCVISSCGGGGGDGFVGAANVSVTVNPREIDIADRARVQITVWDVNEDGILLKVRYPKGLEFVPGSADLKAGKVDEDIEPGAVLTDKNYTYAIFFLDQNDFGENGSGTGFVAFELKGVDNVSHGEVQVDADVNDPEIPDSVEFDINDPQFEAQSSDDITVEAS